MQYTKLHRRNGLPYSRHFDDVYYSVPDEGGDFGEGEFRHVFFAANDLPQRWQEADDFVIAELGFGSSLNCMLTIREWLRHVADRPSAEPSARTLHYIAIEKYPWSPGDIAAELRVSGLEAICREILDDYPPALEAVHCRRLFNGRVVIHYHFMDVIKALDTEGLGVDCWYLDGFAPSKNPAMWSSDVFRLMAGNSRAGATCSTYSAAGEVKRGLQAAGFQVAKMPGYGRKRDMLTAVLKEDEPEVPRRFHDRPWFSLPRLDAAGEGTREQVRRRQGKVSRNSACIIGGGIAGLAAAWSLVQRGWQVEVIDRHDRPCQETSSNPAVIIYPRLSVANETDNAFFITAYSHAIHQLKRLQAGATERFWFDQGIDHYLPADRIQKIIHGMQLNQDFVSLREGGDGQRIVNYAGSGVLRPSGLCRRLREVCTGHLRYTRADVTAIERRDGLWHCLHDKEVVGHARVLIMAAGNGTAALLGEGSYPLDGVCGQVAVLRPGRTSSRMERSINHKVHLTPVIDGRHYLGATYRRGSCDTGPSTEDNRYLLEHIAGISPQPFSLEDVCTAWTGVRSVARDRVPMVGAVPDVGFYTTAYRDIRHGNTRKLYPPARHLPGLYLSAAHGSRGFTTSFLAAEIIAALINQEPLPVDKRIMDYLNPSRFIVHDLQRG